MSTKSRANLALQSSTSKYVSPRIVLSSGTIEALKWLAVVLMTVDHVNRYLLHGTVGSMYALGRLAMPIFAFVLAYSLAQPESYANGVHLRVLRRLTAFAVISCVPYIALNNVLQGWWPLNILFTLLIGTGLVTLLESNIKYRNLFALLLIIVGGSAVEFWWAGLAVFFFSWRYVRSPNMIDLSGLIFSMLLLGNINGNQWALLSLPLIFLATQIKVDIPRIKHVLYVYYPFHLTSIWLIERFYSAS